MIQHHDEYRRYLQDLGSINNHSIGCYIGYLESVSLWLDEDISPELIRDDDAIKGIVKRLAKRVVEENISFNYVSNYKSAMRKYLQMIKVRGLPAR